MRNALSKVGDTVRRLGRSRISAALLGAALVALVGGGTAVASGHIGGDDIRNYSIDKQHLKKDSVGGWEAKDRSLSGGDLRFDSVGQRVFTPRLRERINEGTQGPQGEQGEPGQDGADGADGADGKDGADGVSGMETHKPADAIVAAGPGETVTATATCAEGLRALSGGYHIKDASQDVRDQAVVTKNGPGPDGSYDGTNFGGWEVVVTNSGDTGAFNVYPYVVCAAAN